MECAFLVFAGCILTIKKGEKPSQAQNEAIDSDWFSQDGVDLLVVLQGQLRIEFAHPDFQSYLLQPGDVLVLPARTVCRAYRWPREAEQGTIFLAVYPQHVSQTQQQEHADT